jgi:formiminotetrahydrofolate cyclodeaminase
MKNKEAALIPQKTDEESRREFLVKAGKMALYIPPAMMVLMHPSRKALACGSIIQGGNRRRRHHHHYGGQS